MPASPFAFDVRGARTSGLAYPATGGAPPRAAVILAHGAGAPQTHPWMVLCAETLAARGVDVFTFNFLYTEAKRRLPDKNDVLEATWIAAVESVRARLASASARVFLAGKSMGGRIASQVAARDDASGVTDIAGLVLLGYPLHPPGKPEQLRTKHLPQVRAPMLFVQGARDAFGTEDEMTPVVRDLGARARLFVVEGGDHSLQRPKKSGQSLAQVLAAVADEVVAFTASR